MIYLIHPRRIEMLPPLISLAQVLHALNEEVIYLGLTESLETHKILETIRIQHKQYPYHHVAFKDAPCRKIWQKLTRWILPYRKRRWLLRQLRKFDFNRDILWTVEMEGAAILGDFGLKVGMRHVHSFYELGDEVGARYLGFDVKAFFRSASIVECEYNRAHILRAEKELPRLPFVVPNKPFIHPRNRYLDVTNLAAAREVEKWDGKRVFLYQGALQDDRGELFDMIDSLCRGFPDAIIAVMGHDTPVVEQLRQQFANFSYVPFVPPPYHLEVTSHADVGLAFYKGGEVFGLSPLNPVYCAPNKIYEYSGFGIPVLCNDVPGLRYTVGATAAGICLLHLDDKEICSAATKILYNYLSFSEQATKLFESVDLRKCIQEVLVRARNQCDD